MRNGYRIVDGHVHTFSSAATAGKIFDSFNRIFEIGFELAGAGTVDALIADMDAAGIDAAVTANFAPPKILDGNNRWTLEAAKREPRLAPLVSFHPALSADALPMMRAYMDAGARGVKLHPMAQGFDPADPGLDGLYRFCERAGLPVVFHCGRVSNRRANAYSDLDAILPVLRAHQDLKAVLTHMADGDPEAVRGTARTFGNVSFDTSIVVTGYPPLLRHNRPSWPDDAVFTDLVADVGPDRIVFGSDWPWGSADADAARLLGMEKAIGREGLCRILYGNAAGLFGIGA
jgi:predicted TIM-barrel fold metal-dependent hydrolase